MNYTYPRKMVLWEVKRKFQVFKLLPTKRSKKTTTMNYLDDSQSGGSDGIGEVTT